MDNIDQKVNETMEKAVKETAEKTKSITKQDENNDSKTAILRGCTLLLAAVSFYATAQGMIEYVFAEKWQGYAASFAIQGMLVALNFYLPEKIGNVKKLIGKLGIIILVFIVTFCSSWFSYVYIAGKMFEKSWTEKGHLIVEKEYRMQLYNTQDYLNGYIDRLNDELMISIQKTYTNMQEDVWVFNWENEKKIFVDLLKDSNGRQNGVIDIDKLLGANTTENIINKIDNIIDNMEELEQNPNNSKREELSVLINDEKKDIETRKEAVDSSVKKLSDDIDDYKESLKGSNDRIEKELYRTKIEESENRKADLKEVSGIFEQIIKKLETYQEKVTGRGSDTSNNIITDLQKIQEQMLQSTLNEEEMLESLTNLYQNMQEQSTEGDSQESTKLLNEMQQLKNKLTTYAQLNASLKAIEDLLSNMGSTGMETSAESEADWKKQWGSNFSKLKDEISKMPVYSIKEDEEVEEWMRYDRTNVVSSLEDVQERYINEHNAAEQGIIYLRSPYSYLAIFALILAFFFDVAGFITGVFIEIEDKKKGKEKDAQVDEEPQEDNEKPEDEPKKNRKVKYKYPKVQLHNKYYILTGDFSHIGEDNNYVVFDFDIKTQSEPTKEAFLEQGVYLRDEEEHLIKPEPQEIQFAMENNEEKDGVYMDCKFHYNEGTLWFEDKRGDKKYVTNVERNVMAYSLKGDNLIKEPVTKLDMEEDGMVVLALNKKGTAVDAIYIVYNKSEKKDSEN